MLSLGLLYKKHHYNITLMHPKFISPSCYVNKCRPKRPKAVAVVVPANPSGPKNPNMILGVDCSALADGN